MNIGMSGYMIERPLFRLEVFEVGPRTAGDMRANGMR